MIRDFHRVDRRTVVKVYYKEPPPPALADKRGQWPLWIAGGFSLDFNSHSEADECKAVLEAAARRSIAESALRMQQQLESADQHYRMTVVHSEGWSLPVGQVVDVAFRETEATIRMIDADHGVTLAYCDLGDLEVSGPGTTSTNAGVWGGGFGLAGAAIGMAASTLINTLTSVSETNTFITLSAGDGSATLHTSEIEPEDLRRRVTSRVNRCRPAAPTAVSPRHEPDNIADALAKLVALRDQGALTDEEFQAAKTRLLQ